MSDAPTLRSIIETQLGNISAVESETIDSKYVERIEFLIKSLQDKNLTIEDKIPLSKELSDGLFTGYFYYQHIVSNIFKTKNLNTYSDKLFELLDACEDEKFEDYLINNIICEFLASLNVYVHDTINIRMYIIATLEPGTKEYRQNLKMWMQFVSKTPLPREIEFFGQTLLQYMIQFITDNKTDPKHFVYITELYKILTTACKTNPYTFFPLYNRFLAINMITYKMEGLTLDYFIAIHNFFQIFIQKFIDPSTPLVFHFFRFHEMYIDENNPKCEFIQVCLVFWIELSQYESKCVNLLSRPIRPKYMQVYDHPIIPHLLIQSLYDKLTALITKFEPEKLMVKGNNASLTEMSVNLLMELFRNNPQNTFLFITKICEQLRSENTLQNNRTFALLVAICSVNLSNSSIIKVFSRKVEKFNKINIPILISYLDIGDIRLSEYSLYALTFIFSNYRKIVREIDSSLLEKLYSHIQIKETSTKQQISRWISITFGFCSSLTPDITQTQNFLTPQLLEQIFNNLLKLRYHPAISADEDILVQVYDTLYILVGSMPYNETLLLFLNNLIIQEEFSGLNNEINKTESDHLVSRICVIEICTKRLAPHVEISLEIFNLIKQCLNTEIPQLKEQATELLMCYAFEMPKNLLSKFDINFYLDYMVKSIVSDDEYIQVSVFNIIRVLRLAEFQFPVDLINKFLEIIMNSCNNVEKYQKNKVNYLKLLNSIGKMPNAAESILSVEKIYEKLLVDLGDYKCDPLDDKELSEASEIFNFVATGFIIFWESYSSHFQTMALQKRFVAKLNRFCINCYKIGNLSHSCLKQLHNMILYFFGVLMPFPALLLDNSFTKKLMKNYRKT